MRRCEICEEPFKTTDAIAEMYDPEDHEVDSKIVHAECGLAAGLEIA